MSAKVYIKFPKTGLGNMMLVWARGIVFARLNNLECVTSSWYGIRWGALLRRENKSRLYRKYFIETPFVKRIVIKVRSLFVHTIKEPSLENRAIESTGLFIFNDVLSNNDLFAGLREHALLIKEELYAILHPSLKNKLALYPAPQMSVHIRRGDFVITNQATPLAYFVSAINMVRNKYGHDVLVTIFSDAKAEELKDVLALQNVQLAEPKEDILDILLMSKSEYIVLSRSSTFSYWAAFLSEAKVIRPANDWQSRIKDNNPETGYEEIFFDEIVEMKL